MSSPTRTLPAPEGTIYVLVNGAWVSPGRPAVAPTGDSPVGEPFLVDQSSSLVDTGRRLRI